MKVCFISFEYPPKIFGGLGTYAECLVKGLKDRGIDACIITRGDRTICDLSTYRISTPDILYWQRFYFIKEAISLVRDLNRRKKFDLIHLNGPYPITRSLKLPTVCTFHTVHIEEAKSKIRELKRLKSAKSITDLVAKNPVGVLFDIITTQISDKIICPSPSLAKAIRLHYFADEKKIYVIPNGIDLKKFDLIKTCNATFLDKYAIRKENFILYIGRLSFIKGVEYLIEAFKSIKKECANLKLVIVGSGDYGAYLKKIAGSMKDIIFVKFVDSTRIKKFLYENSLAVVVPSINETFPSVLLEAMACSKPVVATNVGGIPLMIKHGKNGFLVRSKNSKGLAMFIKFLYDNPNIAKKMGRFSRKLVEKEFTLDRMVSNTLRVYESLF